MLQARAGLLAEVRQFFADRQVLEVETPILSHAAGTDVALDPVTATLDYAGSPRQFFLQTSPEFAMKRLLAAGSGPIYQLARSFRNGEAGRLHNPEFTMLEWYRPGFSMVDLMAEVEHLARQILGVGPIKRMTYAEVFADYLGLNPFFASLGDLQQAADGLVDAAFESNSRDTWLDLLFSHSIQPHFEEAVFISHYPASQAALAEICCAEDGTKTALRFELVINGVELANGYQELTDPVEQTKRFGDELAARQALGLTINPIDQNLLAALEYGLPQCAGVALGFDRLLMLKTGAESIADVLAFSIDRA